MSQTLLKILADFTVQLSAPVAAGDTTATLTSATDDDGVALPTGLYGFTIDAGQSNKEYITCTLTGTALTNIKSISRQGAETTGFARAHRRGAKVTVTDWAILSRMLKNLNGDTGFNSSAPLFYDGTANITTANQLATKAYVDGVAISGAGNADTSTQGLVQMATQSQVDNGTTQGSSGAYLVSPLDLIRAKKYHDYAADAGGTDAYAITVTPAITAYATGQEFTFKANTANTGAATLNVNSVGAKTIKKNYNEDLVTGDILANQIVKVVYDGTNMQLVSKQSDAISPVVRTYAGTYYGDNTTRFDITNTAGSTYRYTYDGTGTDPGINSTTFPTGNKVIIYGVTSINGNNLGQFTITGSGANYFEITNASGVAENDKILGVDGYLTTYNPTWTKPNGLKYVVVELVGGGGLGETGNDGTNTGGGGGSAGGYSKKTIAASSLGSTETVTCGEQSATSSFGSHLQATGGSTGSSSYVSSGVGSNGDINLGGITIPEISIAASQSGKIGGSSFFASGGIPGTGSSVVGRSGRRGSGGGGGHKDGSARGGAGGAGYVIVTEYYA